MKTMGRWSVASFVRIALGLMRFGTVLGLIGTLFATTILFFVRAPHVTVSVLVSFRLIEDGTAIRGRPGFGFQFFSDKELARQDRRPRVDTVEGALRIPSSSKGFIAANALALAAILAFVLLFGFIIYGIATCSALQSS